VSPVIFTLKYTNKKYGLYFKRGPRASVVEPEPELFGGYGAGSGAVINNFGSGSDMRLKRDKY